MKISRLGQEQKEHIIRLTFTSKIQSEDFPLIRDSKRGHVFQKNAFPNHSAQPYSSAKHKSQQLIPKNCFNCFKCATLRHSIIYQMIQSFTTLEQLKRRFDRSKYIKSTVYSPDQHACIICMEPVCFPVRCKGCKIIVCTCCARKWLMNKRRCPQKCTETQWHLLPERPTNIEFSCPYDERCTAIIYAETYDDHLVKCSYAPEQTKHLLSQEDLKREYLCAEAHSLEFIGKEWINLVQTTSCHDCAGKHLVRSRCATCFQGYCSQCRPPKNLTTQKCPQGHHFMIRDTKLTDVYCDICSKRILMIGGGFCYNDPVCDFAACINCFDRLPRENNIVPMYEKEVPVARHIERR